MEVPSEKSQKYDRQLRLWGDHGQMLLESCKLCLINATATGCEILKNLILPGIGSFSIIDEHKVTEEDLGNNFFVTPDSLGKMRGREASFYLNELNNDVSGEFIEEGLEDVLKRSPEKFLQYNLVIVTSLNDRLLQPLSIYLWSHNIPLIVCQSYGMIGYLRLVIKDHTVVEAHPEHPHPDLRLTKPFEELVKFCDSIDLNSLSKTEHCHVPWLVLIYKFLQIFKSENDGQTPKSYKEKKLLKKLIEQGGRHKESGVPEDEENFEEAVKAVNTALHDTTISSALQEILDHPLIDKINYQSKKFWILARALKDFIKTEGCLPLQGSIPDMTADSKSYIALQQIYRNKSMVHVDKVYKTVCEVLQSTRGPAEAVSVEDVRQFCKNASNLALINCRSLQMERDPKTMNTELLAYRESGKIALADGELLKISEQSALKICPSRLDDDGGDADDCVYYILLKASEEFYSEYNRYPGCYDDQVEADIPLLKAVTARILNEVGLASNIREDYIHDFCAFGGAELHTISAYMGGVASQEAIKVITKQYVPINNTYIYNGSKQTSTTLEL